MKNEHPGVHLRSCLMAMGISQAQLAKECEISEKHLSQLILGKAPMTASMAVRLEDALTRLARRTWMAEAWMKMQAAHDVEMIRKGEVQA